MPQVVNAVLSRHNFILLGLRGQAKTSLIRMLTTLLDPFVPYVAGSEMRDNPYRPISKFAREIDRCIWATTRRSLSSRRDDRYVEKLATPDVTIADMIGDIDPIKAARGGQDISDELTIHYGLVPRANRGIFAINELPDLAGKIQVGLFNIMQEGDVQIKGYPVRLPLDVMLVFTANPEDYTARGKIITPLKDRIGSEIRTHYPVTLEHGIEITEQESWVQTPAPMEVRVPAYIREVMEQLAFLAREDKRVDKRSGVSPAPADHSAGKCRVECRAASVAHRRERGGAPHAGYLCRAALDDRQARTRVRRRIEGRRNGRARTDSHRGRQGLQHVFRRRQRVAGHPVVRPGRHFEVGRKRHARRQMSRQLRRHPGPDGEDPGTGLGVSEPDELRASAAEFILEGLYAHRRISR